MEILEVNFCHILLFYFWKEKNEAQAHQKLCGVYGDEGLSECQSYSWFFCFVNIVVNDEAHPKQPIVDKVYEIL